MATFPMNFLDALTRAVADASRGFQAWQYGIRPQLDERAFLQSERQFQSEERRRIAAEREEAKRLDAEERAQRAEDRRRQLAEIRLRGMLAPFKGAPEGELEAAYARYGEDLRRVYRDVYGTDLPVKTIPGQPGTPGAPAVPARSVVVEGESIPAPGATLGARREPGRGVGTVTASGATLRGVQAGRPAEVSIEAGKPAVPAVPAVPERTVLDLPGKPKPAWTTVGEAAAAFGRTVRKGNENVRLDSIPEGISLENLFEPLSAPPKTVVIWNRATGKFVTLELPPNGELRIIDEPTGRNAVVIDHTGRVVNRVPMGPNDQAVQLSRPPRTGGATSRTGEGMTAPALSVGQTAGRYRVVRGPRGGQYILDTRTGIRLTTAQTITRANAGDADAAKILGVASPEKGGIPSEVQREYDRLQDRANNFQVPKEQRRITEVRIRELERRFPALRTGGIPITPVPMTRSERLRRESARRGQGPSPVPPRGQAPTPVGLQPVPTGTVPLNPGQYVGQTVQGPDGRRYRSDGRHWYLVP